MSVGDGPKVAGSAEDAAFAAAEVGTGLVPPALESMRGGAERATVRRERLRLLLRSPTFLTGGFIALVWIACALVPHLLQRQDPLTTHIPVKLKPPSGNHADSRLLTTEAQPTPLSAMARKLRA